ncbi:MAG: cytochrome b/b6 domain-containing protein [Pseudomonadota bacterium]
MNRILVWDWPVRIGHWLLVGAFALAWLTSESEELRLVHAFAGGTVVGVVLFRVVWGLIGTRHARFASFVRGPGAAWTYLRGLLSGRPPHTAGHNPAGGLAIVALLGLGLLSGVSGWLTYNEVAGELFEEAHEMLASAMLALALLHVAGVAVGSLAHRENLVRAMFTGMKQGAAGEAIHRVRPLAAVALLVWTAACAWWLAR